MAVRSRLHQGKRRTGGVFRPLDPAPLAMARANQKCELELRTRFRNWLNILTESRRWVEVTPSWADICSR